MLSWLLNLLAVSPSRFNYQFTLSVDPLRQDNLVKLLGVKILKNNSAAVPGCALPINLSEASELNAQSNRSHLTFKQCHTEDQSSKFVLMEISSATLLVRAGEHRLFFYTVADRSGRLILGQGLGADKEIFSVIFDKEGPTKLPVTTLPQACFCLEIWSGNYYHWMINVLPRLYALYEHFGDDIPPIVLTDLYEITDVVSSSISSIGIPREKLILVPEGIYRIKKLLFPATTQINKSLLTSVRHRLRKSASDTTEPTFRKLIYVSRRNSTKRKCKNEAEIETRLSQIGLDIVYAEQLSYQEQANMFSKARLLCGLHGAGLSNMIFMPSNAAVVEIGDERDPVPLFYSLANALELNYFLVNGGSPNSETNSNQVMVDIDHLCDVVQEAILWSETQSFRNAN